MIQIKSDSRGTLGVVEFADMPFEPVRIFWIAEVPAGETRGHHAHQVCQQYITPLSGEVSYRILLRDGTSTRGILRRGDGLHLTVQQWIILEDFSEHAVVLVFCSTPFDENDYIRDLGEFLGAGSNQSLS